MKNKIIPFFSVGIVAVIVIVISDLFAMLSFGSFAWIAFVMWNFISKKDNEQSKSKVMLRILAGIPIGVLLAICMIHIPVTFNNNIIIKYLVAFMCNGIAVLFPEKFVPGIFFGMGLTFSGLGVGIMPNTFKNILIILDIIMIFTIIGTTAAWLSERMQNINK